MLESGTIGLIVSGIVACLQAFTFFENRSTRKEQNLNTFAKANAVKADLDEVRASFNSKTSHLYKLMEEQDSLISDIKEEVSNNLTEIAVIKERVNNEKEFIKKLDEKLDKILDCTCDERHKS